MTDKCDVAANVIFKAILKKAQREDVLRRGERRQQTCVYVCMFNEVPTVICVYVCI